MKKNKIKYIFLFLITLLCGLFSSSLFLYADEYFTNVSGDLTNNVIFVTFSDYNDSWISEIPTNYTKNVLEIMENSYNSSVSSVKNYYKAMSFNKLNINSTFYYDTANTKAIKIPYTENQLKHYSATNVDGYLDYEVCTYTTSNAPGILSNNYNNSTITKHIFSCYDCQDSNRSDTYKTHDLDVTDGIGCVCAYINYVENYPTENVHLYDNLEKYYREYGTLRYVLSQVSSFSGDLDRNGDGKVDALTFIFPKAENVAWSDLLWPHQNGLGKFSTSMTNQEILTVLTNHCVRGETLDSCRNLFLSTQKSGYECDSYNLYLFSDLLKSNKTKFTDSNGSEIVCNFTLAHELGHVLGLPDYYCYDNDYTSSNSESVYNWDLMSYAYEGVPTYLITYNREKLGFCSTGNIERITSEGEYELYPTTFDEVNSCNTNTNKILAYVIEDPDYTGQKIYIEYRKSQGNFDSGFNSSIDGLIIYRVDENVLPSSYYDGMLSAGNFYGNPYNLYVFRKDSSKYIVDESFGNSNTSSTTNAITFQSYDKTKTQENLTKSDITFKNTGLVVKFIKNNDGKITFSVTGGNLTPLDPEEAFFSSVKLKGDKTVYLEYGDIYVDAGIDYGTFSASQFTVVEDYDLSSKRLGEYYYNYTLTYKETGKVLNFTRTIIKQDTTAPTLILQGESFITMTPSDYKNYVDAGYLVSDIYDEFEGSGGIVVTKDIKYDIDTGEYIISYTAKDSQGNESETVKRTIQLIFSKLREDQVDIEVINVLDKESTDKSSTIRFLINLGLESDNNEMPKVQVFVEGIEIPITVSQIEEGKLACDAKLGVGTYNVRIVVEDIEVEKLVQVKNLAKENQRETLIKIGLIFIIGVVLLSLFIEVVKGLKAIKKKK